MQKEARYVGSTTSTLCCRDVLVGHRRVAIAIRHALRWTAPTADAIKQLLIPSERPELKTFHLAGREHLSGVTVAATDLGSYGRLRGVAHV